MKLLKYVIISKNGSPKKIRFGYVEMHFELVEDDELCYGGGMWSIDTTLKKINLFGKSIDFGQAKPKVAKDAIASMDEAEKLDFEMMLESWFNLTNDNNGKYKVMLDKDYVGSLKLEF